MPCLWNKPDNDWLVRHRPGDGGTMRYFEEKNPELKLHALPLEQTK
jgi:hypothetical protein